MKNQYLVHIEKNITSVGDNMTFAFDHLSRILDNATTPAQGLGAIKGFAEELDWAPSYEFQGSFGVPEVRDHLVVEHGLENSAVITFIKSPGRATDLDSRQLRNLLAISYNNLVEWHIFVSGDQIRYINNLNTQVEEVFPTTKTNVDEYLSGRNFDKKIRKIKSRPALLACDDLFIQTVSRWKRNIKGDYRDSVENRNISALFNAIIFVRGCEDQKASELGYSPRLLTSALEELDANEINLVNVIETALRRCGINEDLSSFIDVDVLSPFEAFDRATASNLLRDFYRPSNSDYEFNFALMSKHALSRIYERYVALLEFDEDDDRQMSFIGSTPAERSVTKTGSVYTPQFIAGFFARYVRDNMTPRAFRHLKSIDPACGSGIFLRTLLELQCNLLVPGTTHQTMRDTFDTITGVDRDPNAYEATRLSLMLLHLVALGYLPQNLNIINDDAIDMALGGRLEALSYGAVLANPPYVKLDHLCEEERSKYGEFLGEGKVGRINSYLAFVKLCLQIAAPNGFVCLVLPKDFLTAANAKFLRNEISENFNVRCLVDLSAVPVFERVGTYNILLILQRRSENVPSAVPAQIARIKGFVGPALQTCLDGRVIETSYYDIFELGQSFFNKKEWVLLGPEEIGLGDKLDTFNPVSTYLNVMQGFVSGADDVFIVDKNKIPMGEGKIYVDYLPDRQITRYSLPKRSSQVVFYPYENGEVLSETRLREGYPGTWNYLVQNELALKERRSVTSGDTPWWRPVRPRRPANLLRPKIVCPHLMLTPRFAVDEKGTYAVSHSPFLITKEGEEELTVLKFFTAVLNSSVCQWFLSVHAQKYSRGYNLLEVSTIKKIPVPDPARVSPAIFSELIELVDLSVKKGDTPSIDKKIDELVCDIYGLSEEQREVVMGLSDE